MKYIVLVLVGLSFQLTAGLFVIKDFPQYEFFKQNFSYLDGRSLNTLAEPVQPPVYSLSFLDSEIADQYSESVSLHWDEGISGKAPRFYGHGSELLLKNLDRYFTETQLSAFTLSLYFFPQAVMREESLIEGEGNMIWGTGQPAFRVLLRNGYIDWELENFFHVNEKLFSSRLQSVLPFRPGKWNHLVLGYDVKNARLTMVLNGELAGFVYATVDGRKNGPKYVAGFPEKEGARGSDNDVTSRDTGQRWYLGKGFTGRIDELELFNTYVQVPSHFDDQEGKFYPYHSIYASQVFRVNQGIKIEKAEVVGSDFDKRYLNLYLCQSRDFFPERANFNDCSRIQWDKKLIPLPPAEFFQFFLVYKNRNHALKTFTDIRFFYQEEDLPLPPQWMALDQTRDGIELEWKQTLEEVSGYRIYYRADSFKGDKAMIQLSKRELGIYQKRREFWNYVLEGLEKDTWYFLGIKSYVERDGRIRESDFSTIQSLFYNSDFYN